MNILFIANHLNVGGISSYLLTLGSGLKEKGHQVYLASSGGEWVERFTALGMTHITVPLKTKNEISPKIILSFLKLKKIIKVYHIDLVHSHSRTTQVLGNLLRGACGCAHIFTCHGFFKPRWSRRLFPCWGEQVIAISQEVREHLVSDFKLDPKKISVINNGVEVKNFGDYSSRGVVRKNLGLKDELLIGIIARLSEVKGHIYLIQAMPKIISIFPAAKLLIVGVGKTKDILHKAVDRLGIRANVLFIAETKDTESLLTAMDIFLMPSLQEGLGLALMEAMAQGLAVVGSAVGGIKTLIQDGVNGLLVQPADPESIAQAIIKLLQNDQMRSNLGSQARKFIRENFSKSTFVNKTEQVYLRI